MNARVIIQEYAFPLGLMALFAACAMLRPPLPVDETRYLTVAWEMYLKQDWFRLTVNFEPYSHKPPMMFWLINLFWHIFGVSRTGALIPILAASFALIVLTGRLASALFPEHASVAPRARLLLTGSVPFLIYGSLMMFDIMVGAFTLCAILCLLKYAEEEKILALLGYGLFMGLGVLTKGPVLYVYALGPALLAPLWLPHRNRRGWDAWYMALLAAVLLSFLPALLWLSQALKGADGEFLRWILWKQTADRISGSGFNNVHARPFYFYLLVLPAFFLPWGLFPSFWSGLKRIRENFRNSEGLSFLACWLIPAFLFFSLAIAGKQPHYLAPLMPGLFVFIAYCMRGTAESVIKKTTFGLFLIFAGAHIAGNLTFFDQVDLRPAAAFMGKHQNRPLAYMGNYNGEIGFLGRLEKPLKIVTRKGLADWIASHPKGYAFVRYKERKYVAKYEAAVKPKPYRGKGYIGVFKAKKSAGG